MYLYVRGYVRCVLLYPCVLLSSFHWELGLKSKLGNTIILVLVWGGGHPGVRFIACGKEETLSSVCEAPRVHILIINLIRTVTL